MDRPSLRQGKAVEPTGTGTTRHAFPSSSQQQRQIPSSPRKCSECKRCHVTAHSVPRLGSLFYSLVSDSGFFQYCSFTKT